MRFCVLVLLAIFIAGCSKEEPKVEAVSLNQKQKTSKVLITVNGRKLTRANLDSRTELMVKMSTMLNPKISISDIDKLRKKLRGAYLQSFVREVVLDDYLKAKGLQADEKALEEARQAILAAFRKRGKLKYGDLKRKLGPQSAQLDEYVATSAVDIMACRTILSENATNLPPNWAAEQLRKIKAYNARMVLTNAQAFAQATNVWKKLQGGADFKETAKAFSQLPQEAKDGGEWGVISYQQLEPDEEVAEWSQKLAVGEFSPPIEGDNGVMILRLDAKKGDDYTLSRIYFKLAMLYEEIDEKELEKKKIEKDRQDILVRVIGRLMKDAKVVRAKKKTKVPKKASVKAKKISNKKMKQEKNTK